MMKENKKINAIIIFLIIIILMLFFQNRSYNNKLQLLESQLSSLQHNLNNGINGVYNNIANYIDAALKNSQSFIDTYFISYNGLDLDNKTVDVHMSFRLKQTSPNTKIQVLALPIDSVASLKDNKFEAVTNNGIDYTCDFSLPYIYNYNFDIYEIGLDGYNKKLNSETIARYIKDEFDNRTFIRSAGMSSSKDKVEINFELENETFGQEDFKVKKVELILLLDGKEVYKKDVTNRNLTNAKDIERYNLMVASGEINPTDDFEYNKIFDKIQMDSDGVERGYYFVSLTHEEILGSDWNIDNSDDYKDHISGKKYPEYSYKVQVTYANGEVWKLE